MRHLRGRKSVLASRIGPSGLTGQRYCPQALPDPVHPIVPRPSPRALGAALARQQSARGERIAGLIDQVRFGRDDDDGNAAAAFRARLSVARLGQGRKAHTLRVMTPSPSGMVSISIPGTAYVALEKVGPPPGP